MCGCNKGKAGVSSSCKKYISRLTSAKTKLLVGIQNTDDEVKKQSYQKIVDEINTSINYNSCPKLNVVTVVENFVKNEFS